MIFGCQKRLLESTSFSLMVIIWMECTFSCENFVLQPIHEEIRASRLEFSSLSFQHIFKERNVHVDLLSKEALHLDLRVLKICEDYIGHSTHYIHASFFSFMTMPLGSLILYQDIKYLVLWNMFKPIIISWDGFSNSFFS